MNHYILDRVWKGMRQPTVRRVGVTLLGLALLQDPSISLAQVISIQAKQESLNQIFEKLKKENGYTFFWEGEDFSNIKVNVSTHGNIEQVLNRLFADLPLQYTLHKKTIVIKRDTSKQAPQQIIVGRVLDPNAAPIAGASIRYSSSGQYQNTVTDEKGAFQIKTDKFPVHVLITYVGYQPQEYSISSIDQTVLVQLVENKAVLEEVNVIQTGYQAYNKENTTGAYAGMNRKEIEARNNNTLEGLLEGSIPGLTLYKGPNGVTDMRVRGGSSLRAGTEPLMIIDGFPSKIMPNVNEIENITVLKDAAAAAVWGSQAANGVIVITTKKGKSGQHTIQYSGNLRVAMRPDYKALKRADAATVIDYEKEQYKKGYIDHQIFDGNSTGYSQSIGAILDYDRGDITLEERDRRLGALAQLDNQAQVNELLLRPAVNQSHFIGLSGGSDKFRYYSSANYQHDLAGTKETQQQSFNLANRMQYELAKFVSLRSNIAVDYMWGAQGLSSLTGEIRNLQPYQLLLNEQGQYINNYYKFSSKVNEQIIKEGLLDNGINIYEENQLANNRTRNFGIRTLFGLDWKLIDGLKLSNDFVYERTAGNQRNISSKETFYTRDLVNRFTTTDATTKKLVNHIPYGDVFDNTHSTYRRIATRNQLNYVKNIQEKHYINVLAGFDISKNIADANTHRLLGYNDDLLAQQNIEAKTLAAGITNWDGKRQIYDAAGYNKLEYRENREYSFYGTLAYTYDKRYAVTGSLRNDYSNLFGADPSLRKTPLWSVGGKWLIHNEPFFKSDLISELSVRSTIGLAGNFDRANTTSTYLVATRFFNNIANDYVARLQTPPNEKLRWEKSRTFNAGLDIGLLDNRFALTFDYYRKNSYDLLGTNDLDPTVGLTQATINAASLTNNGVEIGLKADIIRGIFNWNSAVNLAFNKSKVTSNNITDSNPAINRPKNTVPFLVGYDRDALWSYRWAGLDEKGYPQTYDADNKLTYIPVIGSLEHNGTTRPLLSGGWSNTFTYKGFYLSVYTVFNTGHVARKEMPSMYGYDWNGAYNNQIANRWQKPGDELLTDIPTIPELKDLSENYTRVATLSSNSVFNASFLRIREVQFGYTINDRKLLGRLPFSSIRAVAQLNNVYLWKANKSGIDPEAIIGGQYMLPEPKVITFGLNLTL
ncbi:SusC/RagA family TonB-linked outer membrane protein [Sphingobacterium psychroaquaticum]|uniref:SusC/RagA family TonB-linked outer membrane protein n=1 Tax=Sphingobacterium psychroaquaticum TaxID=561061 RepID=UPI00106A1C04|nr:SusC/RagA family TonB-linked outer membrane protein [Sphingobacterium psychroaquaticum]QBQ40969.1 SusC/RagA family TonB-linked outer membrane protein [Sphingobacterium psychroaquaticum]